MLIQNEKKSADHLKTLYRWWYYTFRVRFLRPNFSWAEANIELSTWKVRRLNRSKETNRITQSSSFLSARQIARNQKLSKKISHKKHIAIPITRGRDKRLTMPKGFGAFMMNQCAVLWCGRTLWVALRLHTVTCLASLYVGRGSEWVRGGGGVGGVQMSVVG